MGNLLSTEAWKLFTKQALQWLVSAVPSIMVIILFAVVALWSVRFLLKRIKKLMLKHIERSGKIDITEAQKRIDTLHGILRMSISVVIWLIIAMILLKRLGVDIAPLIAGAGIAGLAIGFGAQELVRDVISGFFILLEDQIRLGDVAIINGTGGLVEEIGLRTIRLRDLSGVVHVFQNGKINTLSNMTKEWSAMVFEIGVAYKEDTDRVVEVMKKVSEEMREDQNYKNLINEPIEVFGVEDFADSAVVIKARLKTKPIQQWTVGREYRRRLKKAFDEQGIEIPFPHRTIYWGDVINPLSINMSDSSKK